MARAATSKTRAAEKSKPPVSQTPLITTHEIVAGKFTEADWINMLERDSNEEFIAEIVDEIIQVSMAAIYKTYIDRQLLPFTITQARDAILEIVQWQFLARDEGEQTVRFNTGWVEDAEPEPAETDCWAQGSMPKTVVSVQPEPLKKISEVPEDEATIESSVKEVPGEPKKLIELPDNVSDTEEIASKSIKSVKLNLADKDSEHSGRLPEMKYYSSGRKVSLRKKSRGDPEAKKLTEENKEEVDNVEPLQKKPVTCSSYIKTMLVRPIGGKDALYDEFGNVIAVSKLDPEKLPTHKVNVKFAITDPTKESEVKIDTKKKNQANAKFKSKMTLLPTDSPNRGTLSRISQMAADKTPTKTAITSKASTVGGTEDDISQRRSLIEEIEVSQGIIVRENGRIKKGPGRYYRKLNILEESMKGMKPISLRITNPDITVADLLDRASPILHSVRDTPPLPPIVPHPPLPAKQMS